MTDNEHFVLIAMNDFESYEMLRAGWIAEIVWHARREAYEPYLNKDNLDFDKLTKELHDTLKERGVYKREK